MIQNASDTHFTDRRPCDNSDKKSEDSTGGKHTLRHKATCSKCKNELTYLMSDVRPMRQERTNA